jgi:pyridoxal phosphate enzyme (YggS family)
MVQDGIDGRVIAERYAAIQERIAGATQRAGRQAEDITLVAVTKTWPAEVVVAAYEAGMRHFGENRAEELAAKRPLVTNALGAQSGGNSNWRGQSWFTWHLIGTLQSRKTALAAQHADVFHALDRQKVARRLSQQCQETGRSLPVFLEVNLSGEESKSGFACFSWEEDATQRENLRTNLIEVLKLPELEVVGLMTMAPWGVSPAIIRSVFRRTRHLAEWLRLAVPSCDLPYLSMGMTDDFEIAIEEGATHLRVGRALFGERN